jgi:hypothetical protein
MAGEHPTEPPRSLRPRDSLVIVESGDVIVWRASHRAVVEYTKGGKRWVTTFWVDEEDGFPQLAHSTGPADDPELEQHWAQIVSEGETRLQAGLKQLR